MPLPDSGTCALGQDWKAGEGPAFGHHRPAGVTISPTLKGPSGIKFFPTSTPHLTLSSSDIKHIYQNTDLTVPLTRPYSERSTVHTFAEGLTYHQGSSPTTVHLQLSSTDLNWPPFPHSLPHHK